MALCDRTEYISLSGLVLDTGSCRLQLNKHLYGMFFCVFTACIFNLFIHMELGCNCFCTCHKKPSTIILMVSFNVFCNPFPQVSSQFLEGEVETNSVSNVTKFKEAKCIKTKKSLCSLKQNSKYLGNCLKWHLWTFIVQLLYLILQTTTVFHEILSIFFIF